MDLVRADVPEIGEQIPQTSFLELQALNHRHSFFKSITGGIE